MRGRGGAASLTPWLHSCQKDFTVPGACPGYGVKARHSCPVEAIVISCRLQRRAEFPRVRGVPVLKTYDGGCSQ